MKKNGKKTAMAALSGGVDSAVAALTMKRRGYDVLGVFLRLNQDYAQAEAAARRVAEKVGIRFYPVNAERQFTGEVVEYFLKNYAAGKTPNPCVRCNREIKFGVLIRLLHELGGEVLATGHYARVVQAPGARNSGSHKLLKGADQKKDQSYFLYTLNQELLKNIVFPVGDYEKEQIKEVADQLGLPVLETESQDICFLNKDGATVAHSEFLKSHLELRGGDIVLLESGPSTRSARSGQSPKDVQSGQKVIGRHSGLPLYTIGQRKGIEIGGTGPYYVVKQDWETNTLVVSAKIDDPELFTQEFKVVSVNWVSGEAPQFPFNCEVVHRYRHQPVACIVEPCSGRVYPAGDSAAVVHKNGRDPLRVVSAEAVEYLIKLKKPERAITPGQSAVFYRGDEVVGGGVIE